MLKLGKRCKGKLKIRINHYFPTFMMKILGYDYEQSCRKLEFLVQKLAICLEEMHSRYFRFGMRGSQQRQQRRRVNGAARRTTDREELLLRSLIELVSYCHRPKDIEDWDCNGVKNVLNGIRNGFQLSLETSFDFVHGLMMDEEEFAGDVEKARN